MFDFSIGQLDSFYHQVIGNVANKVGVDNFEWMSIGELDIEILKLNSEIYDSLSKFRMEYQAWYDYSYENGIGKNFASNIGSGAQYMELSNARDAARNELLKKLNALK